MKTNIAAVWSLIGVFALASAARAQDLDVLKVIPSNADGFAVIAKLGELDKKAAALAKRMSAPVGGILDMAATATGINEGIDRKGSAAFFLVGPVGEKPAAIFVLPVSNYADVLKSLKAADAGADVSTFTLAATGQEMFIGKKGDYAFVTDAAGRGAMIAAVKSKQNVVAQLKPIASWLGAQDVAAVVLEKSIKNYASLGAKMIPDELPGIPEEQRETIKQQMEWMRGLAKSVAEEGTYLALGGKVDADENVKLSFLAGYVKDGRFGKGFAPPKMNPLAGLPTGAYAMSFGMTLSGDSMKSLMAMSVEMNKSLYKLTDEEAKELTKAMDETMKGVNAVSLGMAIPKGEQPLFSGIVSVMKVDDAKEYMKSYGENVQKSNKLMRMKTTFTSAKLGEFPALEVVMDLKDAIKNDNNPQSDKMMEKLFGSDKLTTTLVAVDAKTILVGYVPATRMKPAAQAYATQKMLTADPLSQKTLKLLPENPSMVMLVSPKQTTEMVVKFMKDAGMELPVPEVGETPPVGIGSRSDATSLEVQVALPAEIFSEIGRLVRQAMGI